jgi:hypothetical protein
MFTARHRDFDPKKSTVIPAGPPLMQFAGLISIKRTGPRNQGTLLAE